eukprot:3625901-Rhodomonas_salina.3
MPFELPCTSLLSSPLFVILFADCEVLPSGLMKRPNITGTKRRELGDPRPQCLSGLLESCSAWSLGSCRSVSLGH